MRQVLLMKCGQGTQGNTSIHILHVPENAHTQNSEATTTWYATGPLMCILSTVPPILSACASMRSTSAMIMASLPARVLGVNRLRGAAICHSGKDSTPSVRSIFSSTSDCHGVHYKERRLYKETIRYTHIVGRITPVQIQWLFQRDWRVCDEARNAKVVL